MASCFVTVESSQKASSSEIPKLSEDLKNKERKLDDFENGDKGLNKLWSNLTEINRKVSCADTWKPCLDSKYAFEGDSHESHYQHFNKIIFYAAV